MSGMVPPWQLIAEPRSCVLCEQRPTLPWLTCPLSDPDPIEMDLCSPHLHALLSRRLSARAYRRLRRKLNRLGFAIEQFFLLHESFYDEEGIALQPLGEF